MPSRVILDTDILSEVLKRRDPVVRAHAEAYLREQSRLTITSVTVLEVVSGWQQVRRHDRVQEFANRLDDFEVLPFDSSAGVQAGKIEGELAALGRTIGRADSMIAAIAWRWQLPLVTGNVEHYRRVADLGFPLELRNWRVDDAGA